MKCASPRHSGVLLYSRHTQGGFVYSALLTIVVALQAPGRDSGATVTGQVRDAQGAPVAAALVEATASLADVWSNREGRFELRRLPFGTLHFQVRALGLETVDTTLTLRRGQALVWNVVMHEVDEIAEAKRQDSIAAALGGLDSVAVGLVSTATASGFTYERFGIRLLRAAVARSTPDSSRVLSPLSAGQALALALGAAKDSTAIAIAKALNLGPLGSDSLAARNERFNDAVRARRDITLKVANALWVDTSATLQPSFARWAQAYYGAAVRRQPLRVPEVVPVLNRWADSATSGKIHEIRKKKFADSVEVALTNAVYFKGRWLGPFDSTLTKERPFTRASGNRVTTPTMERTERLPYRRGHGYREVRLPYTSGLTALYLVLPDSGVSAVTVLDQFAGTGWPIPDPQKDARPVDLRLPRLRLTQATDLRPAFTDLNMGILFDSLRADFGGLVVHKPQWPPPCPPLSSGAIHMGPCTRHRMTEATQHVYLLVNEEGTEAAAVTSFSFEPVMTSAVEPIEFFVDRPFLFAVRDEKTGTLLFVGYIAGPRE